MAASFINPYPLCSSTLDYTPIKLEKYSDIDDECEISNWLKFETEPINSTHNSTSSIPSCSSSNSLSSPLNMSCSQYAMSMNTPTFNTFSLNPPNSQLPPTSYTQQNVFPTNPTYTMQGLLSSGPGIYSLQNNSTISTPQIPTPQFYQQFIAHLLRNQTEENLEGSDKRKRPQRPFVRRVRQTRPKVVEAKGAIQCQGTNRKKRIQCRNAALMEYIGPRPIYCAEHIELDPQSLYVKCKSLYQKEPGDGKGCKEVVLKEFGYCYKHFSDMVSDLVNKGEYERVHSHMERVTELLHQLEREAAAAKKQDGDLYQRKNKLIPKFQEMRKLLVKAMEEINCISDQDSLISPLHSLPAIRINSELVNLNLESAELVPTDFKPLIVESLHHSVETQNCPLFHTDKLIDSLC